MFALKRIISKIKLFFTWKVLSSKSTIWCKLPSQCGNFEEHVKKRNKWREIILKMNIRDVRKWLWFIYEPEEEQIYVCGTEINLKKEEIKNRKMVKNIYEKIKSFLLYLSVQYKKTTSEKTRRRRGDKNSQFIV